LRADRQTAGRGRQGRAWASPPGNLIVSTLVRLRAGDPLAPSLALVAAVALYEALSLFAPDADLAIKWPNDVLAGDAKLAGILLERHDDAVVVGIGANLASHPDLPDRAATDLAELTGAAPTAATVAETLVETFAHWLGVWRGAGLDAVVTRWLAVAHPRGTPLVAHLPDGEDIPGLFEGLDPVGALKLRLADGTVRVIHAGEVSLAGAEGE
jgi:BirA family biotin operon repressor/biotin-[acetyl-CoA-carboxylase] ligase